MSEAAFLKMKCRSVLLFLHVHKFIENVLENIFVEKDVWFTLISKNKVFCVRMCSSIQMCFVPESNLKMDFC